MYSKYNHRVYTFKPESTNLTLTDFFIDWSIISTLIWKGESMPVYMPIHAAYQFPVWPLPASWTPFCVTSQYPWAAVTRLTVSRSWHHRLPAAFSRCRHFDFTCWSWRHQRSNRLLERDWQLSWTNHDSARDRCRSATDHWERGGGVSGTLTLRCSLGNGKWQRVRTTSRNFFRRWWLLGFRSITAVLYFVCCLLLLSWEGYIYRRLVVVANSSVSFLEVAEKRYNQKFVRLGANT